MKKIFFLILVLISFKLSAQTYDATKFTLSNKSYGPAQAVPTDARSYFYDLPNFIMRPYQDTIEVLSYLNLPKYRAGNFLIYVHSGGVLNGNGTFTGGTIAAWWFKDGTADVDLVPFTSGGGSNIDTTGHWVTSVYKRADSFFYWKNNTEIFIGIDSTSSFSIPSWNSTMAISPDLLQDYISNFHGHSWQKDSVLNYYINGMPVAGSNAFFAFESPNSIVTLGISTGSVEGSMDLTSSGSNLTYLQGTDEESFQATSESSVNKLHLKSSNNKIQMDLDSVGPPINSLWQDADGFIHRGAISGEGGSGCDTCFIPLSAVLPSLAALPIYARGNNTIVFVKEPKRGGVFTISDTGTADGGKTIPAVGGGFWVRDISQSQAVNLTWFGDSLGRGASSLTRDTTALHAAFNYLQSVGGGTLYVPNPPAFYAFAGHPIWFGNNIKLYGDGAEKSEIRNILPSTGGSFKGPIFQFSTYSSSTTSNPLQDSVPKYDLYTANINDTVLILRNIGDAAGLSAGEVIMYGCIETLKGSKPEFTYWELNEITRISNDSVFFKLPIRINLIDDAAGAHPLLLNINNAGISPLYGFANGTVKNIEISNIKLTQAQEGGNADTTLTNSLAGIWQPGGAFNFYFHDLVIDAYSGIGGNMFTYGTFERIHFKGEKKFFDAGYASSRLRFIDNHDEYKESPASNFATARLIFNSGAHGIYIQNHLSDGDNFRGTQFATFAGVQDVQINGFQFNYPNYYNDNKVINIAGDSDRPSKDIYINNIVVNAQSVGQFLRISQDPNTSLANSNINITNAQYHGGFIGNEGNALFTFTFTATTPPVRNDEYTNNGSTFAFRGGKSTDIGNGVFQAPFIRIAGTNDPLSSGTLTRTLGAGDATLSYSSVVVAQVSEAYALNTSNVRGLHISNFQSEQGKIYINRDSNSTFIGLQSSDSLLAKFNYNTDIGATVPTASDTCLGNALSIIGGIGYINCARLGGGGGGGGDNQTWEETIIRQDVTPFALDHTVNLGGHSLILDSVSTAVIYSYDGLGGLSAFGIDATSAQLSHQSSVPTDFGAVYTDASETFLQHGDDNKVEVLNNYTKFSRPIVAYHRVKTSPDSIAVWDADTLKSAALPTDTLQTNGINNSSQTLLNLVAGSNIGLTESNGSVTIDAIVDSTGCEVFAGPLLYNVDSHTLGGDSNKIETKAYARYQIDSLGNKKVDTLYRTPGKDSIQFTIGGRYHAIKDSIADLSTKLNITDTSNKWVTGVYRKVASDSVFYVRGGTANFAFRDSIGTTDISGKLNISDTSSMLSPYVNAIAGENYLSKSGHVITANPVNLSNTNVTGTLPISKGGTNITGYTTGDILYASATNVLSKLPIGTATQVLHISGGVPAWRDTASITCCYWPLSGTGLGTGATNITYNTPNWLAFKGTYTTTANNQWWRQESPTITARGTASDVFIGTQLSHTGSYGANGQEFIALDIAPTFTLNAFTGTQSTAIRHKGDIYPLSTAAYALGLPAKVYLGVYATSWFGTTWNSNGANNMFINNNGNKVVTVIAATQNVKVGTGTTTTDSLYKLDVNGEIKAQGSMVVAQLPTPVITSITNQGAAGATTYTYKIVYRDIAGNVSGASAAVSTTTGNATLSGSNFNRINFSGSETASLTCYYHDIYRTAGGATQGKLATVSGYGVVLYDDIGGAGDATTAPADNNSGNVGAGILKPTAGVDIRAGTAGIGGAQIKFRNSVLTTTPEPGAMSHKDGLWYIDSSASVRDTIAGRGWTRANITGVTTATASTLMARDANANASVNNTNFGYTTTAAAAGTTTLTVGSTLLQYFTGSTTQTVVLPVASTLVLGQRFIIVNNSTGLVTVQSSGANSIVVIPASGSATLTCILTSGTTAASWAANTSSSIYIDAGWQTYTGDTWDGTPPTTSVSRQYRWIQSGKEVKLWITLNYSGAGVTNTNVDLAWPADVPLPQEPAGRTATNDVEYIGTGRVAISTSSATANVKAAFIIKTGTLTYKGNVSTAAVSAKTADFYISFPTP